MTRLFLVVRYVALAVALSCAMTSAAPAQVSFGVGLSVNIGPPALPVYAQPPCPAPNYLWIPGYWAWGSAGYYWVPGTWAAAPTPGYLWTPGYWAYYGGAYGWHPGYWGVHVGYYGGISYGFGYFGGGYVGGAWYGNSFHYNTAVTNVNTTVVKNVYVNKTVINNYNATNNTTVNRVSYNGGPGGVQAQPTAEERSYQNEPKLPMTPVQQAHVRTASQDRNLLASVNHGSPATTAVERPLSRENRPENFTHVTPEDREAAVSHVVSKPYRSSTPYGSRPPSTAQHSSNGEHPPSYAHPAGNPHPPKPPPESEPHHPQ